MNHIFGRGPYHKRKQIFDQVPLNGCMIIFNATNAWRLNAAKYFEVHFCDDKRGSRKTINTETRNLYIIRREA